jgi:hypothetical protein
MSSLNHYNKLGESEIEELKQRLVEINQLSCVKRFETSKFRHKLKD